MTIVWRGSGTFSNSLPSDPFLTAINRTSVLGSIPPGSYGPYANLLLMVYARTGISPEFNLTPSLGGGPVTISTGGGLGEAASGAQHNDVGIVYELEPNGWSFDAGTSISITSTDTAWYSLTGTHRYTAGSANVVGTGSKYLSELSVGQRISAEGGADANIVHVASITDDTHFATDVLAPFSLSGSGIIALEPEIGFWAAVLYTHVPDITADQHYPQGAVARVLTSTYSAGWSAHSVASNFSLLSSEGPRGLVSLGQQLTADVTGAIAMIHGTAADGSPPYVPDLVNGIPSWTSLSNAQSGLRFMATATWERPSPLDMSFSWTNFPAVSFGYALIVIFPNINGELSPIVLGRSYAQVIG